MTDPERRKKAEELASDWGLSHDDALVDAIERALLEAEARGMERAAEMVMEIGAERVCTERFDPTPRQLRDAIKDEAARLRASRGGKATEGR